MTEGTMDDQMLLRRTLMTAGAMVGGVRRRVVGTLTLVGADDRRARGLRRRIDSRAH